MKKQNTPWIDKDGKLESAFNIKHASKKWSKEQWKKYGQFLSEKQITSHGHWEILLKKSERYQREQQVESIVYDELACTDNSLWDYINDDEDQSCQYASWIKYIKPSLRMLGDRERQVVIGFFWERRTESELAHDLKISRSSVWDYKKSGMEKIKRFLKEIDRVKEWEKTGSAP